MLETSKPSSQNELTYVSEIQKSLTYYRCSYNNVIMLGDFNTSFSNKNMKDMCDMFELNHIIIKTQHISKAQTPHVLIISILTKRQRFLSHLLSRPAFMTTIV